MNISHIKFFALFLFISTSSCRESSNAKEVTPAADFQEVKAIDSVAQQSQRLPSFSVLDKDGKTINLNSLKGKKVFVNLWATWCPPCRQEIPSIEKLAGSLDTTKVKFVMISVDDNFEVAKRFAKNQKLSLPVYYPTESLPQMFNVEGIPSTFIFDKSGTLIKSIEGSVDYNTEEYKKLLN